MAKIGNISGDERNKGRHKWTSAGPLSAFGSVSLSFDLVVHKITSPVGQISGEAIDIISLHC